MVNYGTGKFYQKRVTEKEGVELVTKYVMQIVSKGLRKKTVKNSLYDRGQFGVYYMGLNYKLISQQPSEVKLSQSINEQKR